jgi:glycosyltransferase involved in cell wall biosynthesis
MAQSIVRLSKDTDRARVMGRAGRSEVERRFSMGAMLEAYKGVYDKLLSSVSRTV